MPYILQDARTELCKRIRPLVDSIAADPGYANYVICTLLMKAWDCDSAPRYAKFNEIIGVLECVKQEIYRRAAGPYEDSAINKNGDIAVFKEYP